MTLKDFQNALAEAAAEHPFIEDEEGCIRQEETGRCPLCAVAKHVLGREYGNDEALVVGEALRISYFNTINIMLAADDNTNSLGRKEMFSHVMKWEE